MMITLGALLVGGCGGGESASQTSEALTCADGGAFRLSASPLSRTSPLVNGEATLSFPLTITLPCGAPDTVQFEAVGLPSGGHVTFGPPLAESSGVSALATFSLPASAQTETLTIVAAGAGWAASDEASVSTIGVSRCTKAPCLCHAPLHLCGSECVPQAVPCLSGPSVNVTFAH